MIIKIIKNDDYYGWQLYRSYEQIAQVWIIILQPGLIPSPNVLFT